MKHGQAKIFRRYATALAAIAAAGGLRWLLVPVLADNAPYVTFYIAVVLVSLLAGLGPAIVAAVAGGAAAVYLFVEPVFSFRLHSIEDAVWLGFFFLVSATIIAAIELQARTAKAARLRLAELRSEQEKRAAAERQTERERRWAAQTLASIGDAVIATDAAGRVTFLNAVAADLTGWAPADAAGQPIEAVFHIINEQTGVDVESPVVRVLREGIVVGLANHTALVRKDGGSLPIEDSGAPIRDKDGNVLGAVLVFRDSTGRRRNEEANARLAAIVKSSKDAIISKSLEGVIQTWNPAAERLFGYTAQEAVGRSMAFLVPPGREHEESNLIEHIREGRALDEFETVRRRKDGVDIQVCISLSPLYNSYGELTGVSHISRDITAQKQWHAQLLQAQKLESLGVLAGGVAHDFNNLLTGIIGSGSLLVELLGEDSQEAALAKQIIKAGERAGHLTQQLLAYSGKGRFVLEHLDPSASIREIIELVQASIPRTTELVLDLAEGLPRIEVDMAQFQQVVMNLVINAAEALGGAPGVVQVATGSRYLSTGEIASHPEFSGLVPGEYITLRVRDTGSGMQPATLARIFDPFFTTKFTGRGLGLAAVQGIVRGHNGAIRVESAVGAGTTFEVFLPVDTRLGLNDRLAAAPGKPIILVADDEEVVRETARLTLQRDGYHVLLAGNGQEAVDVFERNCDAVTLVVLDLTMPVLSGKGALERIRALRPTVPVLLFSGYNEFEALRQINDGEIAGFLKKPFTSEALRTKVSAVLRRSVTGTA